MQTIKGYAILTRKIEQPKWRPQLGYYLTHDFQLTAHFMSEVMLFNTEAEAHFIGGSLGRPYTIRFLNEVVP